MSEQRSFTYTYVIIAIVVLIGILVYLGNLQNWKIETYVQTISPIVSALSIVFFVVDRILYEKPHFIIIRSSDSPIPILEQYRSKGLALLIQNDGLMDANFVSIKNYILDSNLKIIKTSYPEIFLPNGDQKKHTPIKVGESIIGLIPKLDFPRNGWGFMRLTIHATFGQENKFLVYKTIQAGTQVHLFKTFNFVLEIPFLIRNFRLLVPDVYEHFIIPSDKTNVDTSMKHV